MKVVNLCVIVGIFVVACDEPLNDSFNSSEASSISSCMIYDLLDRKAENVQVILNLGLNADPCLVTAYVVGFVDELKAKISMDGRVFFDNVPEGEHDIVILARSPKHNDLLGIRLRSIRFLKGVRKEIDQVELFSLQTISGKVEIQGEADHSNVSVGISGTDFWTKSDSEGRFELVAPVGVHRFQMKKEGFYDGVVSQFEVDSKRKMILPNTALVKSNDSDGFIQIAGDVDSYPSRTVPIIVGSNYDALLMAISENETFNNISWEPFASATEYTFRSEGDKTLYFKFADRNGLESSPFEDSIKIDVFANQENKIKVTRTSLTEYEIDIKVPLSATGMKFSHNGKIEDAEWHRIESTRNLKVEPQNENCGVNSIFVRFRDIDGFESEIFRNDFGVDCWSPLPTKNAPPVGALNSAVWTGNQLIVWGGRSNDVATNVGGAFDPASKKWIRISEVGAPIERSRAKSIWTGHKMIVWGGRGTNYGFLNSGGLYDPVNGKWSPVSTAGAPAGRDYFTSIWTGTKMIIWGGRSSDGQVNTGGVYDPSSDSWTAMSTINAPEARHLHTAVWTGSKMIVWGGNASFVGSLNTGGIYDPSSDSWTTMSTINAPEARYLHTAVWTDGKMVVWGGNAVAGGASSNGALYDPEIDAWSPMSDDHELASRAHHLAVSDGKSVVIWGGIGSDATTFHGSGAIYNVADNSWKPLALIDSPEELIQHSFWVGGKVIFWGWGSDASKPKNLGAILELWP